MNFTNFILEDDNNLPGTSSIKLVRVFAAEVIKGGIDSTFEKIFKRRETFSIHLIIDESVRHDTDFNSLLEKIFLIMGSENYFTLLQKKLILVSYSAEVMRIASKMIFKLRAYSPTVYVLNIRYTETGKFRSSFNILFFSGVAEAQSHFRKYLSMISGISQFWITTSIIL